jgi:hypothetical protein
VTNELSECDESKALLAHKFGFREAAETAEFLLSKSLECRAKAAAPPL